MSFSSIYEFFDTKLIVNRTELLYHWVFESEIMNEYGHPYYGQSLDEIFSLGGHCHIWILGEDVKNKIDNLVRCKCIRVNRIKNIFIFIVYWVLVQAMFIASLLADLAIFSIWFMVDAWKLLEQCEEKRWFCWIGRFIEWVNTVLVLNIWINISLLVFHIYFHPQTGIRCMCIRIGFVQIYWLLCGEALDYFLH